MTVVARPPKPVELELSALFGSFRAPTSRYVVRFASTFANASNDGHRELLKQLLPMRDRVEANAITDLTALLQRDLNDRRVAQQLIPYLLGTEGDPKEHIGFFPAVLAVLVPRGYLSEAADGKEGPSYPRPEEQTSSGEQTYKIAGRQHSAWRVFRYADGDQNQQPVGILTINVNETEIIVLDGQHRSNAFRYLAAVFDPKGEIYADFYRDIERPKDFNADLPVTIVWFEADDGLQVEPKLISRRLFVDVNNTAQQVSSARTILLDDRSVSSLATQAFYNVAAELGFTLNRFSLLYSAFDMDSDLAGSSLPAFALTSPEVVESVCLWLLLGTDRYNNLNAWTVDRLRAQRFRNRFVRMMGSDENINFGLDDDEKAVVVVGAKAAEEYRKRFGDRVAPILSSLFGGLSLLRPHYAATVATAEWAETASNPVEYSTAWRKIFLGGEGLFWTFRGSQIPDNNPYKKASVAIERWFRGHRALLLDCDLAEAEAAYRAFTSKAFQIGFAMAADYLASRNVADADPVEAAEILVTGLAKYEPRHWVALFNEVRPLLIRSDTNPRSWPTYRNLLVRMYDSTLLGSDLQSFPEERAFMSAVADAANRRAEDYSDPPDESDLRRIISDAWEPVRQAFEAAGFSMEPIVTSSAIERGQAHFLKLFSDL